MTHHLSSTTCVAMQMGHLARPLSGEQDHLQWRAEVGPERGDLGIAEHPLAAGGVVPLDAGARVRGNDLLPHRPAEDRTRCGKNLVRQHGAAMAAMADLTSARRMLPISSLAHRGSRYLVTSASACRQLLFFLLACSST